MKSRRVNRQGKLAAGLIVRVHLRSLVMNLKFGNAVGYLGFCLFFN